MDLCCRDGEDKKKKLQGISKACSNQHALPTLQPSNSLKKLQDEGWKNGLEKEGRAKTSICFGLKERFGFI
jgi:hypothetical protein